MSTRGKGKKIAESIEEEEEHQQKKTRKADGVKKPPVTPTKRSKKHPSSDAGVTKYRRLKKKQSDSILQAIIDGTSLEELKSLIVTLKKEEAEAIQKRETKVSKKEPKNKETNLQS